VINTSKKYEHRIERLKAHKRDKEKKPHQKEIKSYSRNNKLSQLKKAEKKFQEKLNKSDKTWL
jgi:hypothetical protein